MLKSVLPILCIMLTWPMKAVWPLFDKKPEIDSLLDASHQAMLDVDINATLETSVRALSLSKSHSYELGEVRANYVIGQALFHSGEFEEALDYLSQTHKIKTAKKYPLYTSQAHKVKGQIYSNLQMHNKAMCELQTALADAGRIENPNHKNYITSQVYEIMGYIYGKKGMPDSTLYYMAKNRELLSALDESFVYPNIINLETQTGSVYLSENDLDQAQKHLLHSLDLIEKYGYGYASRTYMTLGDLYKATGKVDSALIYYRKAVENVNTTKVSSEYLMLYPRMVEIFEAMGISDSASFYNDKYLIVENQLSKENVKTGGKAMQILLLEEEKNMQRKIRTYAIYGSIFSLILAFSLGAMLWMRRNRKFETIKQAEHTEMEQKVNVDFDEIMDLARTNAPDFIEKFKHVYNDFYSALMTAHPDLTPSEIHLSALIYLNVPAKDISAYTNITHRSVQTKRSRLRGKLCLSSAVDLYSYLKSLE